MRLIKNHHCEPPCGEVGLKRLPELFGNRTLIITQNVSDCHPLGETLLTGKPRQKTVSRQIHFAVNGTQQPHQPVTCGPVGGGRQLSLRLIDQGHKLSQCQQRHRKYAQQIPIT